jgi:hypothetical protein
MTLPLTASQNLELQKIMGKFLYYARAVDPTMLVTLSSLASQQTKGTERTAEDAVRFLNYCATHPETIIQYKKSDMILQCHSNVPYLLESQVCSCTGGFYYMGTADIKNTTINSAILASTTIMKPVLSSASEAEIGVLFHNCKQATIIRTTLHEMAACSIANSNIKQQQSRAIDMRFYWVCDRQQQGHFNIFWAPGLDNLADYFTKHFPARHHQAMCPIYVHSKDHGTDLQVIANALLVLQGCVKPASGKAQANPNAMVNSQDKHTSAQAINNTNVKSDNIPTVTMTTRLAVG